MSDYVNITRHFRETQEDIPPGVSRRLLRYLRDSDCDTWESLLGRETHAVVLLAPSGTGKSAELRQEALRRRAAGQAAVYCEAGAVARDGFAAGLEADERAAHAGWVATTSSPLLFIDAVDELHLSACRFGDLLRRLESNQAFRSRSPRLVLSARNGAWPVKYTTELSRLLTRYGADSPQPRLVTFEPIDLAALRSLAVAHGVSRADDFVRAYEAEEIDTLLDLRPRDVHLLVSHWNQHGKLGRWSAVLSEFINASFEDHSPERYQHQTLATAEGWQALTRIAAATTLMRTPHVAVPTAATPVAAISARRLFDDWPATRLAELFENPLFVPKGSAAEAVQLAQGGITHFLAARWLAARAKGGMRVETLRDLLLVRIFDEGRHRIPASRREVVGWVGSAAPEFRKLLLQDYPQVVLYEGDPEQLTDQDLDEAVRRLTQVPPSGDDEPWPSKATLRKLARPSLEPTVAALLDDPSVDSRAARRRLLALAEAGRYASCVPHALQHALACGADPVLRAEAIDVVAAAGEPADRARLLALTEDPKEQVRAAIIPAIVPDHLHGPPLVAFLAAGGNRDFCHELARVLSRIAATDLDSALQTLASSLSSGVIGAATEDQVAVAIELLRARFATRTGVDATTIDLLAAIELLSGDAGTVSSRDLMALDQVLADNTDARRRLWNHRFQRAAEDGAATEHLWSPAFGDVRDDDLEWLVEQWSSASGTQQGHIRWPLARVLDGLGPDKRAELRNAAGGPLTIRIAELIRQQDAARATQDGEREQRERREREKAATTLRENKASIRSRLQAIESGDDVDALAWAWHQIPSTDRTRDRTNVDALAPLVGEDHVRVFAQGFKNCWRKQDVAVRDPGESGTPQSCNIGLTGLALEVHDGLDLSTLSPPEAALAARYATYERNAFPTWFAELMAAHPSAVTETLAEVIAREWSHPAEHHGVLRFAPYSSPEVTAAMRAIVLERLRCAAPGHPRTIHYAINALLTSPDSATTVAELLEREVSRDLHDPDRLPEWLRAWAHVAPKEAADWVEAQLAADRPSFLPVMLGAVQLIEQDFEDRAGFTISSSLMTPLGLSRWVRLLLLAVPPAGDVRHAGVYSPGPRDRAQDFRNDCLRELARNPSIEAHAVLRELIADPAMEADRRTLRGLLDRQSAAAAEVAAGNWSEEDVLALERGDEKRPASIEELFALVQSHLEHVARLVEQDDFSYRALFSESTQEREIQLWVASCLRERCRGLYAVVRENVVDDDKEVDISATAAGVGSIPIEIKPVCKKKYSWKQLTETVEHQLLGKYMQPPARSYGILLVVRHEPRRWKIDSLFLEMPALLEAVQGHATVVARQRGKAIRVLGIDMVLPETPGPSKPAPARPSTSRPKISAR